LTDRKFVKARPKSAGPTLEQAQAKIAPARRVAFEILMLVGEGKGHSDELLHGVRMEALSAEDRNLATALVMGVLRWQIALDARLRMYLERPEQAVAEPVANALRLGAFQLLHMDRIPAHAALSESVEMCRAAGHSYATGMVNAILRKVASAPAGGKKLYETAAAFAERLGHPDWLVARWVANYGREAALAICEADQREPVAGGLFADRESAMPHVDDGSRLVAEVAANAAPKVDGRALRVWDCCAAPGGKTLILALRLPGAKVLATDVSAKRMAQMQARLKRFAYASEVRCEVADAAALPAEEGEFDLVLCDAPCSGTGTLARNPEIRLRLDAADLQRQAARQRVLFDAGLRRLAPGGRLVYSTCSLEPEENEAVVAQIPEGFRRVEVDGLVAGVRGLRDSAAVVRDGAVRTLPGVHPCDGFFAVVVERIRFG
jgi:16S rRNA (cytosine967-C5)-methyltransferase